MRRLLYFLFGLLGFGLQGCDSEPLIGAAEYGCPHISFSVKARVVDEAGKPIQGIEVRVAQQGRFPYNVGLSDYQGYIDAKGSFWPGEQYEDLHFMDIDGEANGGEYETLVVSGGTVTQTEEGSGNWYGGAYVKDVGTVTMRLKSDEPEEESSNEENNE